MIISSIDIGTNTVLLLIAQADLKNKKILPLLNEYRIPRIGKNISTTGIFSADSIEKLKQVLTEYKTISIDHKSEKIIAVGTAAFRNAENSDEVIENILLETGIQIRIVSGEEEARLSYLGVTEGQDDKKKRMIIDIGGGSTEVIAGSGKNILYEKSFGTGVVSASEKYRNSSRYTHELDKFIIERFTELELLEFRPDETYAIAGTPTTIASIKLNQSKFIEEQVDKCVLTLQDIEDFIRNYTAEQPFYLRKFRNVLQGREDLIIPGSLILKHIMESMDQEIVHVSTRGIRHGAAINWLLNQG